MVLDFWIFFLFVVKWFNYIMVLFEYFGRMRKILFKEYKCKKYFILLERVFLRDRVIEWKF